MLALRWRGRGDVALEDVPWHDATPGGMIDVAVELCGVCGSDLAEIRQGPFIIRDTPHPLTGHLPPVTLGHEFVGRVIGVGPGISDVAVGDRVAADACWRCETCVQCRSGRYNLCPLGGSIGLASDGGFAEKVRFPAYCAVPLPTAVSTRAAALLEPLAVGLHALERGSVAAGQQVVVLGYGPIGAAVATVGAALGLRVAVIEPHQGRRARAVTMGFETLEAVPDARAQAKLVKAWSNGGVDLAVDASGATAAVQSALSMPKRGGRVVLAGVPKDPITVDGKRLLLFEGALIGALGYHNDLPRVAAMIAGGQIDAERLITHTVPLVDSVDALHRLATDPGDQLKVLVQVAPE